MQCLPRRAVDFKNLIGDIHLLPTERRNADILETKGFELQAKVKCRQDASVEGVWIILAINAGQV